MVCWVNLLLLFGFFHSLLWDLPMLLQHSSTLLLSISSCVCDVRVPAATILPAEHSPPRHSHCSQSWSLSQTSLVHDLLGTFCCFIFYIVFKGYSPFIVIKIYSLLLITASVFHFRLFHNWQFDLGVFFLGLYPVPSSGK